METPRIREITPSSTDKFYGRLLNEYIQEMPDDCWVVVRDSDTMYLQADRQQIMEQAIQDHPDTDLFTCATNRVWGLPLNPDPNILNHHALAQNREKRYIDLTGVIPAFWWMFPKRVWIERPFDELPIIARQRSFDARWTMHNGWKKRRIDHLYVFHFYRLNKKHTDYTHLI